MIFSQTGFTDYCPGALLKVSGDDAAGFLQGQFTNDLRQEIGGGAYGVWLTEKGKVIADSHVMRVAENEFLIVAIRSRAEVIQQRLEQYIIADDVSVTDETASSRGLLLQGENAGTLVERLMGVAPTRTGFVPAN